MLSLQENNLFRYESNTPHITGITLIQDICKYFYPSPLFSCPPHTLKHTHKHITLDILLSPWHVLTNLHYFFINHCQLLSQIYHLLCYPWSPLLQNVEISQVKYSFNTSELSHIFKKSFKSIPIPHLQNTLLHKHSGQTHLHCLCTLSSASWHKNLMGNLLSLWFKSVPR